MLFNSLEFCIFIPVVFVLYWFVFNSNYRVQNLFLVIASYIFYGWWDWRFLFLIVLSSCFDFAIGLFLDRTEEKLKRKWLVASSVILNVGLLGYFKYYNFFIDSFADAFTFFGHNLDASRLDIVLPVGISFYTFQTMSYTFDVYRKRIPPTKDIFSFFAYVSFFPQLVAGPIEKAVRFLPQFLKPRSFKYDLAVDGLRQVLLGFFKKIVIADNCAIYVNGVFANYQDYNGSTLLLAAFLFTVQLYGDFSGYSDIAIGTGRLFGFDLSKNFDFSLFTKSPAEFWRKWHITLTSWFRDYLLSPLGGYRGGNWLKIRNTIIVFVTIGFWHGANWTFVIFGFLNAIYILPEILSRKVRKLFTHNHFNNFILNALKVFVLWLISFYLITLSTIFFRSTTASDAMAFIGETWTYSVFEFPQPIKGAFNSIIIVFLVFGFLVFEFFQKGKDHALQLTNHHLPVYLRWGFYYFLLIMIIMYGGEQQEFVYFQF